MSKSISAQLKAHLEGETTTLATCWKLTRKDGVILGFTDHDTDLVIGGVTYEAETGYTASSIASDINLSTNNLDVQGILESTQITAQDLSAGRYDEAEVEMFIVNWDDLTQGILRLPGKGWIGNITTRREDFVAEVRGLDQALQQIVGEVYQPTCRADLGDSKCKVDLDALTVNGVVSSVTDRTTFAASGLAGTQSDDFYKHGLLTWTGPTGGDNVDLAREVDSYIDSTGTFTLILPMGFDIQVGDTFSVYPGCDKTLATCRDKFDNVINFRGEPFIPGLDKTLDYPL